MSRKKLDVNEALQLFYDLPSDNESVVSGSDSDKDFIPPLDTASDSDAVSSQTEDEDEDINLPGPSHTTEIRWKRKGDARANVPAFLEKSGPADEIILMEDKSPLALFLSLFTITFIESIVFQTNLYATQEGKPFKPLELQELYKFLAINLLMGIKKLPSYRDYWSTSEDLHDGYISQQMSVKRFSWILSHLHLNDNSLQPKKGDANFDKLFKIRPLISHLSDRFLSVLNPSENQAIDESMIRFKGRSSLKQYMPKKPIKRGYKVWMRCDQSGFACQFDIYTGKREDIVEGALGERVVKHLTNSILGKNHKLYMDNYFTSYNLFSYLDTQKVFACGTVNLARKNLPKNFVDEKKMKRGECDWFVSNDGFTCLKWKDKRCVTILSTGENSVEMKKIERKEKDGKKIQLDCPKAVMDYRKNMGFVDHFDHLKSLYEIDRKSRKWWHRIFFHFLDVSVVNSFILYTLLPDFQNDPKNLKDFRREIVIGLISMGNEGKTMKRKSSTPTHHSKKQKYRVSDETRLKNADHLPVKCKPKRCAFCSTKAKPHYTRIMCQTCNVGLCLNKQNAECFEKFHSK